MLERNHNFVVVVAKVKAFKPMNTTYSFNYFKELSPIDMLQIIHVIT